MKRLSLRGLAALPLALISALFNTAPMSRTLGVSYNEIATSTLANYVSGNSAVQQQLWIEEVLDTNGAQYQSCPFAQGAFTGRVKVGTPANDSQLQKAVVEITDTSKVRGDTINIFSEAGIGGEGVTGDTQRNGSEAQIVTGNLVVKIGNQFFAVGYKQSAVDKTMIGQNILNNAKLNEGLKQLHCQRKNNTIIYRMKQAAGYGSALFVPAAGTNQNLLFPPGIANREALKSANTLDLPTIMQAGDVLPGIGAMPMNTVTDSGGSVGELFMFMAPDKALFDFESDPTNNQYLQYAAPRDKNGNPIFAGGFFPVRGHGMYRWIHRDHANYNAIGSPLMARAKLSVATTNTAAQNIRGGGTLSNGALLAATDTTPQWFRDFSNAPVTMYGGIINITARTDETRYIQIIGSGGYSIFGYTVNNGNLITTSSQVSSTATTPYVHSVGDLIMECNSSGTIFCQSLMFGAQAVVGGNGSINGSVASPEMGRMVVQELDYKNDVGVSIEGCAGYSAVTRAGDNSTVGFVVVEHSLSPNSIPGAKNVT